MHAHPQEPPAHRCTLSTKKKSCRVSLQLRNVSVTGETASRMPSARSAPLNPTHRYGVMRQDGAAVATPPNIIPTLKTVKYHRKPRHPTLGTYSVITPQTVPEKMVGVASWTNHGPPTPPPPCKS